LYVYLMEESERRRTRLIRATDSAIRALVGVAPRTLCNARKKLREYGLILYKAEQGNRYAYTICDPKTGAPYPGDPKDRMDGARRTPTASQDPMDRILIVEDESIIALNMQHTLQRLGYEVVGTAGEAIERMDERALGERKQQGGEVERAPVLGIHPAAERIAGAQGRPGDPGSVELPGR